MLSVKVSTKHQIVVPSAARKELGIGAGDRLDVQITDDAIVLRKRPPRASDRWRGIHAGRGYYEPDPVTFVRRMRDEVEARLREREDLIAHGGPGGSSIDRA